MTEEISFVDTNGRWIFHKPPEHFLQGNFSIYEENSSDCKEPENTLQSDENQSAIAQVLDDDYSTIAHFSVNEDYATISQYDLVSERNVNINPLKSSDYLALGNLRKQRCKIITRFLVVLTTIIVIAAVIIAIVLGTMTLDTATNGKYTNATLCYAMYVWKDGWDSTVPGCDDKAFLKFKDKQCFTHNWNSTVTKNWLFKTCTRVDREIVTIYVYDMHDKLTGRNCDAKDIIYIRETIREGKTNIQPFEVYGLLSSGGEHLPERHLVKYFIWYNRNCATSPLELIDGVALYNGDYKHSWSFRKRVKYLDNLQSIVDEAAKQLPTGSFKTHFSAAWMWGIDSDNNDITVPWRGNNKYIMHHFIDIFDSLDIQVAYVLADEMVRRLKTAGIAYSLQKGKQMLVNVNTNKDDLCQTTFFPTSNDTRCSSWARGYDTEEAMFAEIDKLQSILLGVRVVLHYFRGIYSSGGNKHWPAHGKDTTNSTYF